MPRQLPPKDSSGRFIKKASSKQPASIPNPTPESEASTSHSVSREPSIESPSPILAAVSRSPLVFPPPVRHSIPGSFSPLADSPSETSVPVSTLISHHSRLFVSPSSVPVPDSRIPSPISLPESVVPQFLRHPLVPQYPIPIPLLHLHPRQVPLRLPLGLYLSRLRSRQQYFQ